MYRGLDRLIGHFLATAEQGSISAAARALNITQPALTRNIRALEQLLDEPLFERHAGGVRLTASGQVLARRARFMQLEFDHAMAEIQAFKEGWQSEITIGASPSWGLIYIPEIVAAFCEQVTDVRVKIISGSPRQLLADLFSGELDIVCSGGLTIAGGAEVVIEPMIEMERVIIAGADHPLVGRDDVSPDKLLHYPWISRIDDEISASHLRKYFLNLGLAPPRIDIVCNLLGDLLSILRRTWCLGTVPLPVTRHSIAAGIEVIPIRGTFTRYQTGIIYRREPDPTETVRTFLECIRRHFRDRPASSGSPTGTAASLGEVRA